MRALALARLVGKSIGVAVQAGVLGLSLKTSRQAAVRTFTAELKAANLPLETIAELCELYPDVNLTHLLHRKPPQESQPE